MASYDAFRRDSNLSPAGVVLGTPPPAGPAIHNMPMNSFRNNSASMKGRLNAMNLDGPQGYYHHQTPSPSHGPPSAGYAYNNNKVGGVGGHNQLGSNEYYGKYEIEFNHHHSPAGGPPPHPPMKGSMSNSPHMDHHHGASNPMQQHSPGFAGQHHQQGHKMLNEFNNKSAVQFNGQQAAGYFNNNGQVNPELNPHVQSYHMQQHQQQQQQQFHHQNYHHLHNSNNNNFEGMDPAYYHHHHHSHHHAGHHHTAAGHPGHLHPVVQGANKAANNFYEANNNNNYQHEYGEMSFPNAGAPGVNVAAASPMTNHHHAVVGVSPGQGSAGAIVPPVAGNVEGTPLYIQQQQLQQQYAFEAAQANNQGHGGIPHHQHVNGPPAAMQGGLVECDYVEKGGH